MPRAFLLVVIFTGLLGVTLVTAVDAQEASNIAIDDPQPDSQGKAIRGVVNEHPEDPEALLSEITERRSEKDSVFTVAPLQPLRTAKKTQPTCNYHAVDGAGARGHAMRSF